jgi:hypothetical protein
VKHRELDRPDQQQLAALRPAARAALVTITDTVVIIDRLQNQRRPDERDDPPVPLRTLHFGPHHEGPVTFLVYPPDDLMLIVRIQ